MSNEKPAKDDDADISSEEASKNREHNIKLKEAAYETLGKAWPENSKTTQEKYREMFVEHTVECLPTVTRSIQISVMSALYSYVDKLLLLKESNLAQAEQESLERIMQNVIKAVQYALGNIYFFISLDRNLSFLFF